MVWDWKYLSAILFETENKFLLGVWDQKIKLSVSGWEETHTIQNRNGLNYTVEDAFSIKSLTFFTSTNIKTV